MRMTAGEVAAHQARVRSSLEERGEKHAQAEDIRGLTAEVPAFKTESEFAAHVIGFARDAGWDVRHETDSRKSPEHWPDLEMLRDGTILVAELKLDDDAVKSMPIGQCIKLLAYARAGVEAHLWRPSMLRAIEERLR